MSMTTAYGLTSHGVDLASFQHDGGPIDYQAVVEDLVSRTTGGTPATDFSTPVIVFILIKLTESNNYVNQWAGGDALGFAAVQIPNVIVKVGFYHFVHSSVDQASQHAWVLSNVPAGCNPVIWIDVESGGLDGQTWEQMGATVNALLSYPEFVGAYTNGDGLPSVLPWLSAHGTNQAKDLWFADPSNLRPEVTRAITQIGQGTVGGIVGQVDLDTSPMPVISVIPAALESSHTTDPAAPTIDASTTPDTPAPTSATYTPSLPTLYEGTVGAHVNLLQRLLWDLDQIGAWSGWVDGIFGPATRSGVIDFQIRTNLPPTGVVDPATWTSLLGSTNGLPELTEGNDDQIHTKIVQAALLTLGYYLVVDGIYGPVTTSIVQQVQSQKGLVADGIVGPLTWPVLIGA